MQGGKLEGVTVYHWMVFILAAAGWLFDCTGQRIFVLAREPALQELLGANSNVDQWGRMATFILMVGWGTGGILFGMMSDKYGRVKAMVATLMAYTIFSGLSGLARNGTEFLIYRFLCGTCVGGMFGAATTLLAESVPARFRSMALGLMQTLSACGNMLASGLSGLITPGQENYWKTFSGWQVLFFVSVVPAVLAVPMLIILKEPESWKKAKADAASGGGKRVGNMADLFRHPRWRKSTLIGVCLGVAGMVGLWGIAFFSPELITTAFKDRPLQPQELLKPADLCLALKSAGNPAVAHIRAQVSPEVLRQIDQVEPGKDVSPSLRETLLRELNRLVQEENLYNREAFKSVSLKKGALKLVQAVEKKNDRQDIVFLNRQLVEQVFPGTIAVLQKNIDRTKSRGTLLQDVGSLLGMLSFTFIASYFNRRTAFWGAFIFCLAAVSFVFYALKTEADVYWMLPMMGFATLSCFAGYSIYFPELFPTRLRGTGVGFCYNTVRYVTASFILLSSFLTMMPFRTVAVTMTSIYLVGIVALFWAPETKGQPLPED